MALWRRLAEVSDFRAALQTSAVTTLAAEPPPTAKLTSFELSYRTKLNAKRAATGATKNEGPSLVDWLRDLQLPGHIAIKPEFAVWFDSEHSILKAMRCRRNDTFWPWMVNAQMIPAEVTGVDPSDVPPQLRNVFGDVFLRLTALPPCKPDPVTGEAASTLPLPVFVWFFTTVCQMLYPGSHNAATAFVTEEWRLSSVTSVSLSTAAWLRRDMGPDGATPARRVLRAKEAAAPPAPDRKRKANERTHDTAEAESTMLSIADVTEDSEPGVSFPLFSALLRILAEPLTRCEASASLDPTMAALKETMHLIETYLVPHCFKDECIRRYLRSNKPGGEKESPVVSPAAAPAEPPSPAVKPKLEHTNSNASLNASTTLNTSATGGLVLPSLGRAPRSMVHVTSSTPVPPPSTSLLLVDHRSSQQHDVMTPPENKHATAAARNSGFLSTAIATAVAKTQVPQVGQIKLPPLLLPSAVS